MNKIILKKKIIKFGKKITDIRDIKKDFILKNDFFLKHQIKKNNIYRSQPKRKKCKNCEKNLLGKRIIVQGIKYVLCRNCDHLTGAYEDTEKFIKKIYTNKSFNYSKNYYESEKKNYINRVKNIYEPKANFLKLNLKSNKNIKILDYGSGSGYFLAALDRVKFKNFLGIEISNRQVLYGKTMLKKINVSPRKLKYISYKESLSFISKTKSFNCITLMGVLEHINELSKFMACLKNNRNFKIVYLVVPLFSFTAVLESIFPSIFNRHLGGSHTHLFTEKSLKYLFKKNGFTPHSEWWFGQDFNDFSRCLEILSKKYKNNASNIIVDKIKNLTDNFQLILDKNKLSSEAHIIFFRK